MGTNENGGDIRIIQALLCAGLYPNIAKVRCPAQNSNRQYRVQLHWKEKRN
eukprot:UN07856